MKDEYEKFYSTCEKLVGIIFLAAWALAILLH